MYFYFFLSIDTFETVKEDKNCDVTKMVMKIIHLSPLWVYNLLETFFKRYCITLVCSYSRIFSGLYCLSSSIKSVDRSGNGMKCSASCTSSVHDQ